MQLMDPLVDLNSSSPFNEEWLDQLARTLIEQSNKKKNKIILLETEIGLLLALKLGCCFQRSREQEKWRYVSLLAIDPWKILVGASDAIVPYEIILPFSFFIEITLSESNLCVEILANEIGVVSLLNVGFQSKRVDLQGFFFFPKNPSSSPDLISHGFSLKITRQKIIFSN